MFNSPLGLYGNQGTGYSMEEAMRKKLHRPLESGYSGAGLAYSIYPAMVSGQSGYAGMSTVTGVPEGTPVEAETGKVGGGVTGADSDAGETPATTTGMAQGGTAAS